MSSDGNVAHVLDFVLAVVQEAFHLRANLKVTGSLLAT